MGNTRVRFNQSGNELDVADYYPFGMAYEDVDLDDPYRYNGKELYGELGLNWYDYGARWYDPAVGRFTGVDAISDQFPHVATYNYAENEPIANIDGGFRRKKQMTEAYFIL